MINCRLCKSELIEGINWYSTFKQNNSKICIPCAKLQVIDWKKKNRERYNKRQIKYNNNYRQKNKNKIKNDSRERRLKTRIEILSHYSNGTPKCACCGETILEFLCIDHVNGGGLKHRKSIGKRAGREFYQWLKNNNFPAGFQVLCYNCNCAKGFCGYCPHKNKK